MGEYTILASSSSLLLLLLLFPSAYADDLNPPDFRGEPNSLHFEWNTIEEGASEGDVRNPPDVFNQVPAVPFPQPLNKCLDGFPPEEGGFLEMVQGGNLLVVTSNFVDSAEKKLYRIQVTHTGDAGEGDLEAVKLNQNTCQETITSDCEKIGFEVIEQGKYFEDWECKPNPDVEGYEVNFDGDGVALQVVVDTISFPVPVGGTVLSPDTISLLVLQAESSAVWWLPALILAGAGLALFKIKKKN